MVDQTCPNPAAVGTQGNASVLETVVQNRSFSRALSRKNQQPVAVVVDVFPGGNEHPVSAPAAPEPALDGGGAEQLRRTDPEAAGATVIATDRPTAEPGPAKGVEPAAVWMEDGCLMVADVEVGNLPGARHVPEADAVASRGRQQPAVRVEVQVLGSLVEQPRRSVADATV